MSTETPKPASTPTISFRVERAIEEQIQQIAKSNGQSKSDWVRDQVMRSLHGLSPSAPEPEEPDDAENTAYLIKAIEARIEAWQTDLRGEIQAVKNAIRDVADSLHRELCTLGVVILDAQESIEQRTDDSRDQLLDAIERAKQSQRSLLQALAQATGGSH